MEINNSVRLKPAKWAMDRAIVNEAHPNHKVQQYSSCGKFHIFTIPEGNQLDGESGYLEDCQGAKSEDGAYARAAALIVANRAA